MTPRLPPPHWMTWLDEDDLTLCMSELRAAIITAERTGDGALIEKVLREWRATAEQIAREAREETE